MPQLVQLRAGGSARSALRDGAAPNGAALRMQSALRSFTAPSWSSIPPGKRRLSRMSLAPLLTLAAGATTALMLGRTLFYTAGLAFRTSPVVARAFATKSLDSFGSQAAGLNPNATCLLRIIQITDVYTLSNFPHMRVLLQEKRREVEAVGGRTISMLTGDFLAPYLLSSIDGGVGMMRMLNGTPIDYVTWGNHEDDVGHENVMMRAREYSGRWINTNMQSHESFNDSSRSQVDSEVIELESPDGSNKRRVGLMGILTNSPSLYRPGAFGGATIEDPWETMALYNRKLREEQGCDLVLPLCHLYEPQDERTCHEFDFPLILGGHDHHVVDRTVAGTRLLKPGQDGHNAWQVDIIWQSSSPDLAPVIEAQLLNVADWPADKALVEVARDAYSVLDPLRQTQLGEIPASFRPLTSLGSRSRRVSMATFLLSRIRDAMNLDDDADLGSRTCDCALLKGGNIRGGRDYDDNEHLTLEVLLTELENPKMLRIPVPGYILQVGLRDTFGQPNPGWMQYDDGVILDEDGLVTHVHHEPLELDRIYMVASISDFWRLRDAHIIGTYFKGCPEQLPDQETGKPLHPLLLRLFAWQIWSRLWSRLDGDGTGIISAEDFRRLDVDGDGSVSREDVRLAITNIGGLETSAEQTDLVDKMFEELAVFRQDAPDLADKAMDFVSLRVLNDAYKHWQWSRRSLAASGFLHAATAVQNEPDEGDVS